MKITYSTLSAILFLIFLVFGNANRADAARNIVKAEKFKFSMLPKGQPVPPEGPSPGHNGRPPVSPPLDQALLSFSN
ncbi:hypothetical protein F511_04366 [Dorcoceras hygrometricum]|uniref:Uncharacterized protein n=1 Tax=Dorcoceras hygrometricum TaxID=472368 RepID=A0A2Z7BKE7_9LAMI|nr:hypothetical protein F511_04366 [Dorcoceras hygrometricum]